MNDILQPYVKKLDHVAIAVHSIRAALPLFRDMLGGEYHQGHVEHAGGFRWMQLTYPGGGKLELLEPVGENSFLHKFLQERGEGVHHITFIVQGIEELVERLKAEGYSIVGEDYRNPAWKEAFISPRSAHGTVVQFAETILDEAEQVEAWRPDPEALLRGDA